ncbi:MAG: DUF3891 family protein [Thermoanaerobaculia bacterium]|nr:DUF3891 family protein [Thermoanaerobaculia bacterium]
MIVLPLRSSAGSRRLQLVTQTDHAAFSAEVLSLWREDGLPGNPRRQALLRGTREHDNGWAEADSAPRRREDGVPHDFRSIPREVRLEIFQRAVLRKAEEDPEAWVYVVRHARELHRGDPSDEAWDEALDHWLELEDELRAKAGLTEEELAADYRYLQIADSLSLTACLRRSEPQRVCGVRMFVREDAASERDPGMAITLHLEPFPFAGSTTFQVRCRVIPDRYYSGDADLAVELATARWQDLQIRVARH